MGFLGARRPDLHGRRATLWAYLNDPMPIDGPARLLDQKRIVDATAAGAGSRVHRYVVDSGSRVTDGRGARLQAMIEEAGETGRRITLLVADLNALATTPPARRAALAELLAAGLVLKDTSGELHPDAGTVALARASASRRRGRSMRSSDRSRADA